MAPVRRSPFFRVTCSALNTAQQQQSKVILARVFRMTRVSILDLAGAKERALL
jgi:hypothetical protein